MPRVELTYAAEPNITAIAAGSLSLRDTTSGRRTELERYTWDPSTHRLAAWPRVPLMSGHAYAVEQSTSEAPLILSTFTTMSAASPLTGLVTALDDGSAWRAIGQSAPELVLQRPVHAVREVRQFADEGASGLVDFFVPQALKASHVQVAVAVLRTPRWLGPDGILAGKTPTGREQVSVLVVAPDKVAPVGGWPAVIFSHGLGGSRLSALRLVGSLTSAGFAVVSADAVGHGFGRGSQTVVVGRGGAARFSTPGRARDVDGDGVLGRSEGFDSARPAGGALQVGFRDAVLQSASDQVSLLRAVQAGLDLDHDGRPDITAVRGVVAESAGGFVTTPALGAVKDFPPTVLTATGSTPLDFQRTSYAARSVLMRDLAARRPALSVAGSALDGGLPVAGTRRITLVDSVTAGTALFLSRMAWLQRPASPDLWASIAGNRTPLLIQAARGDPSLDNRLTAALVTAGGWLDRTAVWRFDLVTGRKIRSRVPDAIMARIPTVDGRRLLDAHHLLDTPQAQQQVVTFFLDSGRRVTDPDGRGSDWEAPLDSLAGLS